MATLATAATALNANTVPAGEDTTAVTAADSAVNAGPYTDLESIQSTDTRGYMRSPVKAAGICA